MNVRIPLHKRRRIWRSHRDRRWRAVPSNGRPRIFSDSTHGGSDGALQAAIAYRDACDGPADQGLVHAIERDGKTFGYAVVLNRKERYIQEYFGIRKYKTLEAAKRAAEEFRNQSLALFESPSNNTK